VPGHSGSVFDDEVGARAPRGFDDLAQLNDFKQRLSDVLPPDVDAVMQGSAVENGGKDFRSNPSFGREASDFDVALSNKDLFSSAQKEFPNFAKDDRVGPLKESGLNKLGIDTGNLSGDFYRDTKFMIYPDGVAVFKRGPGYPLVTRK
jgi:hypothetical protein